MPSLSQEAILASSPQFVYCTQHYVVWNVPLSSLGQLSRLPAVHLLTGRACQSQKSLIWGKLSATAKKLVCYQHEFKTATVPAAKKKNKSLLVETRTGTQGQAAVSWGCPSRERREEHPEFGSQWVWSEFNLDLIYSLLALALLSICLFTPPSEYISSKLTTITDQWMDQEREKVTMTVRCKLQSSFCSLKPDPNPVPDILTAKEMYVLSTDSKTYFKVNPRCSTQECICVCSDFGLMNSWVLLCQMCLLCTLFRIINSFCKMKFCSLVVFLLEALNVYLPVHQ